MFRLVVLASLAAAPCLVPLPVAVVAPALAVGAPCDNVLPHEPILVYEVSGFTLIGLFDRELVLYHDGTARLSSASDGAEGKCTTTAVSAQDASDLLAALSIDGAFLLCDQDVTANDVPMSTLTIMRPKTDTRAHTYSWWFGDGAYGTVEQRLNEFITTAFPNF